MNTLRTILVVANIIIFIFLGAFYFLAFDLEWGISLATITWGLPLLICIAFTVVSVIFTLKKQSWKWGVHSFVVALIVFLFTLLSIQCFDSKIVGEPHNNPKETLDTEENRILALFFNNFFYDRGYYVVIDPDINNDDFGYEIQKAKNKIVNSLPLDQESEVFDVQTINSTLDKFLALDLKPFRIGVRSEIQIGYYIDYDNKFGRYFESKLLDGWNRWHLFHPDAGSSVHISSFAYDQDTGIVAIHFGLQGHYLAGCGNIVIAKLENNHLKYLVIEQTWVS